MPRYTRKEFINLCGDALSASDLRVNIKRGKVVEDSGFIDSSNATNAEFVERWNELAKEKAQNKPKAKNSAAKSKAKKKPPAKKEAPVKPQEPEEEEPDFSDRGDALFSDHELNQATTVTLDKMIKRTSILKAQESIRLDRFKKQRLEGKVIPTDMVREIFAQHFKNVTDEFYQSADNLVTEISESIGASRDEMVKLRSKLKKEVNQAVKIAKDQSEKDILAIVEKYSESLHKVG